MKVYIKYILYCLAIVMISSCMNTLDTKPTEIFDDNAVWGSKATVEGFINATYAGVIIDGYVGDGASWEAKTPNGVKCSQVWEGIDNVATELALSTSNDWGISRFGFLRRANKILEMVAQSDNLSEPDKKELLAHGHLLRGMIFFKQARLMGRLVPVMEVFDVQDTLKCKVPMTKDVAESYKYVIDDLKIATEGLPESNRHGLPTKWAADVLLSRASLQAYAYTKDMKYLDIAIAASKDVIENSGVELSTSQGMFNELDEYNPEILWAYYRDKENTSIGSFSQFIRTFPNVSTDNVLNSKSPVQLNNPNGQTFEGWAIFFPTQDMVDQFLTIDEETQEALPWYETSQYKKNINDLDPSTITDAGQIDQFVQKSGDQRRMPSPQDFRQVNSAYAHFTRYGELKEDATKNVSEIMYSNRDKRFYTAIVYDNCKWLGEQVGLNLGGNVYRGVRDKEDGGWYNTTTGYYWRKSSIEKPEPRANHATKISPHFNLCRLGEAYLNLAEAYLCKNDVTNAVKALNKTRTVHGGIAESKATTEEQAWKDYIRERNCEMVNEGGDLYFSYLRWGKYGGFANHGRQPNEVIVDLDRPVYMMQINRDRSKYCVNQMTLLNSAHRSFTPRRYLLPVNQNFLNVRAAYGIDDKQNVGW